MKQDAIVLLHGFNHDHRCWNYVIDELHAMAPEVPVYAVDLPGRGDKKWKTARMPKPAREYLWCCKSTPKEKRDFMHDVVVWERVSLFAYPVTREGMLHKNIFWVRTLQDRSCPQRLQSFYRDNLGVDEELYIDAPHDCMITHPHELAELILQSYRKCLNGTI